MGGKRGDSHKLRSPTAPSMRFASKKASSGNLTKKPPLRSMSVLKVKIRSIWNVKPRLGPLGMLKPRGEGGDRKSGRVKVCAPLAATSSSINAEMSRRSKRRLGLTKSSSVKEASISPEVQHFAHTTVTGGTPIGSKPRRLELLPDIRTLTWCRIVVAGYSPVEEDLVLKRLL